MGNKFLKPMEYKFKLTLINNLDTKDSLTFESPFILLQPKQKGKDISMEYPIAEIPINILYQGKFRTAKRDMAFTLQVQEVKDINVPILRTHSTYERIVEDAKDCEICGPHSWKPYCH